MIRDIRLQGIRNLPINILGVSIPKRRGQIKVLVGLSSQILLKNRKLFTLTKDTYPFSYDIPTSALMNEDSDTKWQILPQEIWEVHIVGDSLYGVFQENQRF